MKYFSSTHKCADLIVVFCNERKNSKANIMIHDYNCKISNIDRVNELIS